MASKSNGNCYLCGAEFSKISMKNHLLKAHGEQNGEQECCLLKIEGTYNKDYWLYVDMPIDKSLSGVDSFLRKIWLECCGHMSGFFGSRRIEVGKARKLRAFSVGDKLFHEYDFGSTTDVLITVVGMIRREKQKENVRLLARNIPPQFECETCENPADYICIECKYHMDNPFYCAECSEKHEHVEMFLPVTNSPRMGECGYDGELDVFAFNPAKFMVKK